MKGTINTRISELANPEIENIKFRELELKHLEKLYTIQKQYLDNLINQKKEIARKLQGDLSDHIRELLVTHLKEIENEIAEYRLDDSKIEKLKAEIDLLKEKVYV